MEYITIYYNRKMYSKTRGKYITLTQIRDHLKAGGDIQVCKHGGDEDVTEEILTHVLTVCENIKYSKLKQLIVESASPQEG